MGGINYLKTISLALRPAGFPPRSRKAPATLGRASAWSAAEASELASSVRNVGKQPGIQRQHQRVCLGSTFEDALIALIQRAADHFCILGSPSADSNETWNGFQLG